MNLNAVAAPYDRAIDALAEGLKQVRLTTQVSGASWSDIEGTVEDIRSASGQLVTLRRNAVRRAGRMNALAGERVVPGGAA